MKQTLNCPFFYIFLLPAYSFLVHINAYLLSLVCIPFVCPFSSFWSFKRAAVSLHFILALIYFIRISFNVRRFAASLFRYIFFSLFLFYSCCCCVLLFFLLHSDFWFNFKHFILVHHAIRQLTNGFSFAVSNLQKPFCHLAVCILVFWNFDNTLCPDAIWAVIRPVCI